MKKDFQKELIAKFIEISKMRWVKGINNNINSVGLTFESLIGKQADSMFFPDYYGIEIKCSQRYSRYPLALFSLSFDGPNFYEMNRLLEKFGKTDYKYKNKKMLIGNISVNEYTLINEKYFFKLEISDEEEKIYICVYDKNCNLIEKESYINFQTIKDRLEIKLSKMALVFASKKEIDHNLYFRYYQINLYELRSFYKFLELLKKGYIKVTIMGRISRSGLEEGRQRNKNLIFLLPKENISMLFQHIYTYDADTSYIRK